MKTVVILFIFLISFSSHAESLHAVSFNLHCTFDDWKKRIEIIAGEISKRSPDFIAFQEVCRNDQEDMVAEIATRFKQSGYSYTLVDSQFTHMAWDKYEEHLMVLTKVPVEGVDKGFLPSSPLQRAYIGLKLKGVWFVNTHLEYLEDHQYRTDEINFLTEKFKKAPHIVMGDFNSSPDTPEQTLFTQKNYVSVFPGASFPSDAPKEQIDGFWVSKELRSSMFTDNLLFKVPTGNLYMSDHLGVELNVLR